MNERNGELEDASTSIHAYFKGLNYYFKQQWDEALTNFDKALEDGVTLDDIDKKDLFSYRAECLQTLKYHYEAIEDFDKAIEISPTDCQLYFSRSISKGAILDYLGEISDLKKAIELSEDNTSLNREYNGEAQKMGYSNAAHMFSARMVIPKSNIKSEEKWQDKLNNATSDSERKILLESFEQIRNLKLSRVKRRD